MENTKSWNTGGRKTLPINRHLIPPDKESNMHGKCQPDTQGIDSAVQIEEDIKRRIGFTTYSRNCSLCRYLRNDGSICQRNPDVKFRIEDPDESSCDKWSK